MRRRVAFYRGVQDSRSIPVGWNRLQEARDVRLRISFVSASALENPTGNSRLDFSLNPVVHNLPNFLA